MKAKLEKSNEANIVVSDENENEQYPNDSNDSKSQCSDPPAWQKYLFKGETFKTIEEFYLAEFDRLEVKEHTGDGTKSLYLLNDMGIAQLFHEIHKDIIVFVREVKCYYVYDGRRYQPDLNLATEISKEFFRALAIHAGKVGGSTLVPKSTGYKDFEKYAAEFHNYSRRKSILADAATIAPVSIDIFDNKPKLINLPNGTYDLEKMELREHRPDDYLTMMYRPMYDPNIRYERWDKFINEIMEEDSDKILYLQKCLGYAFSGDVSQECFFVCYGPKARNGKSTLIGTIEYLLGDYAITAQPQTIAKRTTNGAAPSPDIARLKGTRLVNMPEPPQGLELDAALVKQMTGGDPITARFLRGNPIQFLPSFKMIIPTNHMPKIIDPSLLKSGRMKVVQFNRSFIDNPDTDLKNIFRKPEAMTAILNWLIEGYKLYKEDDHLEAPKALKAELDEFRKEAAGQLEIFLENNLIKEPDGKVRISDIHRRHSAWAIESNLKTLTKHAFLPEMESRYGDMVKRDGKLGNFLKGHILVDNKPGEPSPT